MSNSGLYNYSGVIHIHTKHSDGTGNIKQIVKSAKRAGLDWIIVTDHYNMDSEEGFIEGILVIKGEEISPDNQNHYLALGINEPIFDTDPKVFVDKVREHGGFGFIAHPDESDFRKNKNKPIKWLENNVIPDGIEIWNWFSQWADNYNNTNIFSIIFAYLVRNALITKPYEKTLKRWDDFNNMSDRIMPAIGGLDAHALKLSKIFPVKIFPYNCMLKKITNYIHLSKPLSQNFEEAKSQVLTAIHAGNNIIVNRKICKEFPKVNIKNQNETVFCGYKIKLDSETYLNIELPKKTNIKIVKDGEEYKNFYAKKIRFKLEEVGKYRVEGTINKKGYFYTNPINVI